MIYIVNQSNLPADQAAPIVAAIQAQLNGPFFDYWESTEQLVQAAAAPAGAVVVYIAQTSDIPGALGYHDVDTNEIPYAKVFVDDSAAAGVALSSVLSHEILELMADRFVDSFALQLLGDPLGIGMTLGTLWNFEDCDPVQGDIITDPNGVQLSNFVTPAWFDPANTSGPFDFAGNLSAPFTLSPGGYANTQTVLVIAQQQVFARRANASRFLKRRSRA